MKLFCAIVGVEESAFEVDIAEDASVSALKKAIRAELEFGYPNSKLQFYLAKSKEGECLDAGATAVVSDDLQRFTPMNPTLKVGNNEYFG
ncbi:hypothetical protein P3T76_007193 [Phytophthora citrophthora]|uniref:Crinkler effector protein N-terminal domain-containing protein n=1 Tax=Phytophthora citrophthora TaxID=4793 RepID=A0AAD9GMJ7_9STRA|nr:hypothetical protein P3T76_007193 [Phytophthora citrophthora]